MFAANFPVLTQAHTGTGEAADGNMGDTWADPVPQNVVTYYSETSTEPAELGRTVVVTDVVLLARPGFVIGPYDKVTLPPGYLGGEYTVEGLPDDYTNNPFGELAGIRVHLRKVEG